MINNATYSENLSSMLFWSKDRNINTKWVIRQWNVKGVYANKSKMNHEELSCTSIPGKHGKQKQLLPFPFRNSIKAADLHSEKLPLAWRVGREVLFKPKTPLWRIPDSPPCEYPLGVHGSDDDIPTWTDSAAALVGKRAKEYLKVQLHVPALATYILQSCLRFNRFTNGYKPAND